MVCDHLRKGRVTGSMATAIAYSFMQEGENERAREEDNRRQRRHTEHYYNQRPLTNPSYDEKGSGSCGNSSTIRRGLKRTPKEDISKLENPGVQVQIVVQFFKVGEIDTLKEQFNADVVVKAKWREPAMDRQDRTDIDSIDLDKLWNPKLYIENALGDPKEHIRHRLIYNDKGEAYIYQKRIVKGTFMENLELNDFPFDVQDLTITVASELPSNEVELVVDPSEHHVVNRQSFVDEQEWHLYIHTECSRKELVIDQADNSVKRASLSVKCRAARRPGYFVWNIFLVTDKYLLASMIMLSGVCTWHAIVTRLLDNRTRADEIEEIVLTVLGILYVLYNLGFVVLIYLFPCKKRRIMAQKDREYKTDYFILQH
ncbi:hypothetical protein CHS0354_018002 [Potamilus streckersoni]|uniref:Neurotransmitter-gated ion-channel ligand-binding domain-containing protein n=1 Tax=Potamilus streckersoni TaxID=2493646 RepID=A0AAE0RVC4_9BIVA|nr:hypothetical protein CHS0354_018002 [Potamilus streckersoni]